MCTINDFQPQHWFVMVLPLTHVHENTNKYYESSNVLKLFSLLYQRAIWVSLSLLSLIFASSWETSASREWSNCQIFSYAVSSSFLWSKDIIIIISKHQKLFFSMPITMSATSFGGLFGFSSSRFVATRNLHLKKFNFFCSFIYLIMSGFILSPEEGLI